MGILEMGLALSVAQAADMPREQVVRYLLATVEAFRTLYTLYPNATRKDFKKGDLMGALVVRLKEGAAAK